MGAPGVPLSRTMAEGSHERTAAMPGMASLARTMALAACVGLFSFELGAFERVQAPPAKPETTQNCPGLVAFDAPRIIPAAFRVALTPEQVRLTYVGHSTFLIESPQLVRIATDYNDYVRSPVRPDIVTMNHAHTTHFTDSPDPAIKYVLRGWGPTPDQPARQLDLHLRDGESVHRPPRAPAPYAQSAAAQRDRPRGRRPRPGRRQFDARSRRHDGSFAGAQGAADDPHALFQSLQPRALPRAGTAELDGGNERGPLAGRVEDELTDHAQSDGIAGALSGAPRELKRPA